MSNLFKRQAVFGAADGVTSVLGLLVTLTGHPSVLFKAALGVGLAELVGMTAGAWLSDEDDEGFLPALTNGAASCAAILLPAAPYLFLRGTSAIVAAILLIGFIAGVISWLRPEKGFLALAETYGVLLIAAAICTAATFI
jgi:hypothetical protein